MQSQGKEVNAIATDPCLRAQKDFRWPKVDKDLS